MNHLKDINWNQVYYFHEVAKSKSMTKAAQALGVSLPTVSEQIRRLEDLLKVELFHRSTRRMDLTDSGWELFNCTREMFAAGMRFLDKVSPQALGGYATRVGVQETISAAVALEFLYRYEEAFTQFGTVNTYREPSSDGLFQKIIRGELDWGISIEPTKGGRLECKEIGSFEVAFCCSKSVFDAFAEKTEILRSLPLIRSPIDRSLNSLIMQHLSRIDAVPEEVIESDYREYCIGLAHRGRCVAPIAVKAIEASPWKNKVKTFSVGGPITVRFYAVWAKASGRMAAIKKLLSLLDNEFSTFAHRDASTVGIELA
jgi:DNA-binding transcriptional LysR family regulator